MQRAFIVTGVLTLGCVLVFGAAALAFALFPHGGSVSSGWNSNVMVDRAVAVPAPAIQIDPDMVNEKGVEIAPVPIPVETPPPDR